MQVFSLRPLRAAAFAGVAALTSMLVACGGGGSSHDEVGPSDVAPAVTLQPADASATAAFKARFTATATGAPAPTVQWQRSNDGGTTWTAVAGATTASYTTPALTVADNGTRFRAVFANAAGSATTNAATLAVAAVSRAPGLSLLAGDIGGPGTLDGTGAAASFVSPQGMAIDSAGNLYVADWQQNAIRKVTPAGVVTTLAGPGALGVAAALVDGVGPAARFNTPVGIAVDPSGNVYVGDFGNYAVRKITPDGTVSTLAGGQFGATDVDGVGTAARFGAPIGVAVDSHGNVFVADQNLNSIRKITPGRVVSTFAGVSSREAGGFVDGTGAAARFNFPQALAIDSHDNLYVGDGSAIRKITPAAVVTTVPGSSAIGYAHGITVDPSGNLFVADQSDQVVRKIDTAGTMTVFAGTVHTNSTEGYADGVGAAAAFHQPSSVVVDADGNLFVGEAGNAVIRKVTPAAVVTTFAGSVGKTGRDDGVGAAARFTGPGGLSFDPSGNLFLADVGGNAIRKLTLGGDVTTLAGAELVFGSADGPVATAHFKQPYGTATDAAGNVYVSDAGNGTLRKITPDGIVSTLAGTAGVTDHIDGTGPAASFASMDAIASDANGNVYVAEASTHTIRKVTPAGVVSTLAGQAGVSGSDDGPGVDARFHSPYGLAVDGAGNVLVADAGNATIRKITPAGVVSTVAGSVGVQGSDDGTGGAARFQFPYAIAADPDGNAYVGDLLGITVRKVTPAGVVTTLLNVPGRIGIRLGTVDPSVSRVGALCWLPTGQLALSSGNAVLLFSLP